MARKRWVYYIPRLKKLTGGQKDHWMKLYVDRLLASLRFKKLTLSEKGFWLHMVLLADRNGELRSGNLIYTVKDLMEELNTDAQAFRRISRRLLRKNCGLLARKPVEFPGNSGGIPKESAEMPTAYDHKTAHNKKNKKRIKNNNKDIPQEIGVLLNLFSERMRELIGLYWKRVALLNKSKIISEGRKLTLLLEIHNAYERFNNEGLFVYGMEQAISHDAPHIGYVIKVCKNTIQRKQKEAH